MRLARRAAGVCALLLAFGSGAAPARGETQTFLFSVTTDRAEARERWAVHYDAGVAAGTAGPFGYDGVEQRLRVQGRLGRGFTLLGTAGLGLSSGKSAGSVEELELLKDVVAPAQGSRVSVGLGVRREWEGTSVLLGRVSAGRRFERSELVANLRLERAFSAQRDALDVVTTVGWLHGWGDTLKVGLEGVGEDLEGLWETEEAEGGAKLFVGPSLHVAPPGRSWSLSLCGGPLLLEGRRTSTSSASRELGTSPGRAYTVRLSVGYTF